MRISIACLATHGDDLIASQIHVRDVAAALQRHGERVASPRKLRFVYDGMPDVDADQRARPGSAPVRLITIARLCEHKDHATISQALAQ